MMLARRDDSNDWWSRTLWLWFTTVCMVGRWRWGYRQRLRA